MRDQMTVRPAQGYAGDVSPQLAWAWVQADLTRSSVTESIEKDVMDFMA